MDEENNPALRASAFKELAQYLPKEEGNRKARRTLRFKNFRRRS